MTLKETSGSSLSISSHAAYTKNKTLIVNTEEDFCIQRVGGRDALKII